MCPHRELCCCLSVVELRHRYDNFFCWIHLGSDFIFIEIFGQPFISGVFGVESTAWKFRLGHIGLSPPSLVSQGPVSKAFLPFPWLSFPICQMGVVILSALLGCYSGYLLSSWQKVTLVMCQLNKSRSRKAPFPEKLNLCFILCASVSSSTIVG